MIRPGRLCPLTTGAPPDILLANNYSVWISSSSSGINFTMPIIYGLQAGRPRTTSSSGLFSFSR